MGTKRGKKNANILAHLELVELPGAPDAIKLRFELSVTLNHHEAMVLNLFHRLGLLHTLWLCLMHGSMLLELSFRNMILK